MSKILVMRYADGLIPPDDLNEEKKKEIGEKLGAFLKDNPETKFNGLWLDGDGMGVCDWEAPDVETVEKALDAVGMPLCERDEIIEVEKVMP